MTEAPSFQVDFDFIPRTPLVEIRRPFSKILRLDRMRDAVVINNEMVISYVGNSRSDYHKKATLVLAVSNEVFVSFDEYGIRKTEYIPAEGEGRFRTLPVYNISGRNIYPGEKYCISYGGTNKWVYPKQMVLQLESTDKISSIDKIDGSLDFAAYLERHNQDLRRKKLRE